jgi:hypothetical protein
MQAGVLQVPGTKGGILQVEQQAQAGLFAQAAGHTMRCPTSKPGLAWGCGERQQSV